MVNIYYYKKNQLILVTLKCLILKLTIYLLPLSLNLFIYLPNLSAYCKQLNNIRIELVNQDFILLKNILVGCQLKGTKDLGEYLLNLGTM